MKDWIYNELKHVGVDYSKKSNANIYDEQMESFRNYEKEVKTIIDKFGFSDSKSLTAIDIGCGTGAFSIHAAKYLKKIYAVDVSKEMLKIASSKAKTGGIKNIEFFNSGFLHFQPDEKVDVIFSKWAFHHLPDYWKQAGLLNMNKMLKPGGILLLTDLVFKFDPDYDKNIEALLNNLSKDFSSDFVEETKIHIRDEYSTFDWILQGLIERAGFTIEHSNTEDILTSEYFCRKVNT
ncbi:MAG: class I SAM-dependent methyltransferase [bacterium]|nr:class I SAM-dependent methyltransferase [bacterium]